MGNERELNHMGYHIINENNDIVASFKEEDERDDCFKFVYEACYKDMKHFKITSMNEHIRKEMFCSTFEKNKCKDCPAFAEWGCGWQEWSGN